MACCNTWFRKFDFSHGYISYYQIPCGYCLNCRKDKQQYLIDRAQYEYKTRLTAAFVTFTYNDFWNIERCAVLNPNGGFEYDKNSSGELVPRFTLRYDDLTSYIENIRHYIKNHPEIQNVMCQPDFSYMYVGEYGDLFQRNHFHVLFFGLDFAYCKKILFDQWKYGFIDVLPLLDGGISYVTKYIDKSLYGQLAKLEYDDKGKARPKIRMSLGFGKGLLTNNIQDIKDNGMTYLASHNIRRPISAYWKRLITGNNSILDSSKTLKNIIIKQNNLKQKMKTYNLRDFSVQSRIKFNQDLALRRERDLEIRVRNSGHSVQEFENVRFTKYYSPSYRHSVVHLPIDLQRILADNYRDSLSL